MLVLSTALLGSDYSDSNKQHDFSARSPKAALERLSADVQEARAKYAGSVEIRWPGHPLFGRKVVVSRVHLVYDGERILPEVRRALLEVAERSGVELHFHSQR